MSLSAGVPQGSVLGPLLWYNGVLQIGSGAGIYIIAYAVDSTVVVAEDSKYSLMEKGIE